MIKRLYPNLYLNSINEIDTVALKQEGIKGIIFDIDNTLVPYDVLDPTDEIISFFERLKSEGFQICLASNNTEDRVVRFNKGLKVFAIHKSGKPSTKSFKRALELMHLTSNQAVIVGDQIFTDVFGGNRANLKTILVKPVSEKDEWITKVKRGIERKVIAHYEKHNR
ncbi:YqeG family HAD IIIA-type phosphatase [Niameybacter massiliensis]|uniref:YqeG family HAD IIIA-type phosphatase n=1 Tax=Holtiella tumoricola TaxID=3018743 RepID=A0AA42DRR0_9FIRM|nr:MULTISPECIES: YqeG family HAD IIIA-type phosphatase [Lachnospirales]MDA3733783.1 YqeG family HAD IIIA-type phosphatase [Holtiella tumoricola]